MPTNFNVFISSKMVELKAERDALYALLPTLNFGDIRLHAWVFEEDAPANSRSIRDNYLKALQDSALYLGLFWNAYGEWTIDEFERAREWGMERHIYVKDVEAKKRDSQLADFLKKHGSVTDGITAKWFKTTEELCQAVTKSIEAWIIERLRPRSGSTDATFASDSDDLTEKPRKLFGRDSLKTHIYKALDEGERVLLQGFGGMGKTALAATLASEWIAEGKGAALWLRVGSSSDDAAMEALARPFKQSEAIARETGDNKVIVMRQILRQSGAKLLVLDDCWNGSALFSLMKAVPSDIALIVTARQRHALDSIIDVGELHPADALALLNNHAKNIDADTVDADALCKLLGYHAFAIEIAGKILKAQKLSPSELISQIENNPHSMKVPGDYNAKERTSVKDLLDTSIAVLDDKTRRLFLNFGAFFSPTVTPEMLQLYASDITPIESCSATLEIHGLIERIPPSDNAVATYRLHDLAYSYVRAQSSDAQRNQALDACLTYLGRYNRDIFDHFSALRPELDNFLNAVSWALETKRYEAIKRLAMDLWAGHELTDGLLPRQGLILQGIKLLEQGVEAAIRNGDKASQAIHLNDLGNAYHHIHKPEAAIRYHEQALEIFRELDRKRSIAICLGSLGNTYSQLGNEEKAIEFYEQALAINREVEDHFRESTWLLNLSSAYYKLKQVEKAIEYYEQALNSSRQHKARRDEGNSLYGLGYIYRDLKQFDKAVELLEQALAIVHEIGDRRLEAMTLGVLGTSYHGTKKFENAIVSYDKAVNICKELGNRFDEGVWEGQLGNTYRSMGQMNKAMANYEQALAISQEIGDQLNEATWLNNLAVLHTNLGELEKAIYYDEKLLVIRRETNNRSRVGELLADLGNLYFRLLQLEQAISYYEQAVIIFRQIENHNYQIVLLAVLGEIYQHLGKMTKAISCYEQALDICRQIATPSIGKILINLGSAYLTLDKNEQAIACYEQALTISRENVNKNEEGICLGNLGSAYFKLEQFENAIIYYEQVIDFRREINNQNYEMNWLQNLGVACLNLDKLEKALLYLEQALAIAQEIGDQSGKAIALTYLGELRENQNEFVEAIKLYSQARMIFFEIGEADSVNALDEAILNIQQE